MKKTFNSLFQLLVCCCCIAFFGQDLSAQCGVFETEFTVNTDLQAGGTSSYPNEIHWTIIGSDGSILASTACGDFAGLTGVQTQNVCLPNSLAPYTIEMYDDWGDGWNGGANIEILLAGTTDVALCATIPDNGAVGDEDDTCNNNSDVEASATFDSTVQVCAECGDLVCEGAETYDNCPSDCPCILEPDWVDSGAGAITAEPILICEDADAGAGPGEIGISIGIIDDATATYTLSSDVAGVTFPTNPIPHATISYFVIDQADVDASGGAITITFTKDTDANCVGSLTLDLATYLGGSGPTAISDFCSSIVCGDTNCDVSEDYYDCPADCPCDVVIDFVELTATGGSLSATPNGYCGGDTFAGSNNDTLFIPFATLSGSVAALDTAYLTTTTVGTLVSDSTFTGFINYVGITSADVAAGTINIDLTSIANPADCLSSVTIDLANDLSLTSVADFEALCPPPAVCDTYTCNGGWSDPDWANDANADIFPSIGMYYGGTAIPTGFYAFEPDQDTINTYIGAGFNSPLLCQEFFTGGVNTEDSIFLYIGISDNVECVGSATNPYNVTIDNGTFFGSGTQSGTIEDNGLLLVWLSPADIATGTMTATYTDPNGVAGCSASMTIDFSWFGNTSALISDLCPTTSTETECTTYGTVANTGPYVVFTVDDPDPLCEAGSVKCAAFQAWGNESYTFTPVANNQYEWNFCNDCDGNPVYDATAWGADAIITVGNDVDDDNVIENVIATGTGCSITFTAPDENDIIVNVTVPGGCGAASITVDNGFPTITTIGGGVCGVCGDLNCDAGESYCDCADCTSCADETSPSYIFFDTDPADSGFFGSGSTTTTVTTAIGPLFCSDFVNGTNPDGQTIFLGVGVFGPACVGDATNPWDVSTTQGFITANGADPVTSAENATVYFLSITQAEIDASGGTTTITYSNPNDAGCSDQLVINWADFGATTSLVADNCPFVPTDCASADASLANGALCAEENISVNLSNVAVTADQTGWLVVYDNDPTTVPTSAEVTNSVFVTGDDILYFGEYFGEGGFGPLNGDPSGFNIADFTGFEPSGCTDLVFDIYLVPADTLTLTIDPACQVVGPLSLSISPRYEVRELGAGTCMPSAELVAYYDTLNLTTNLLDTIYTTCAQTFFDEDTNDVIDDNCPNDLAYDFSGFVSNAACVTDGSLMGTITCTCGCQNPPTISADATATVCEGSDLDLSMVNASFGGGATSASWSTSGDGSIFFPNYTPGPADIAAGTVTLTFATDDPDGAGVCEAASTQLVLTITSPEFPTGLACYQMATLDPATCTYTISGEQDPEPATACYETATFNDATCVWDVTGEQDPEPATACYETATFNDATCVWDVTGEQNPEPSTACYETATFNDVTCVWDVTGEQDPEPSTACYETATFNDATCVWDVTGEQDPEPSTACYETATFNDATCVWDVTGEQDPEPSTACYETATFNDATCMWDVTGDQDPEPSTACYETAVFNDATCMWDVTGEQPAEPTTACYETATFNDATCMWDVTGELPAQPTDLACYQSVGAFNDATCMWDVNGEEPLVDDGCDLTADSYDPVTCAIINEASCPEGTSFNSVDCSCDTDVVPGCTDPCATNYDPGANSDDGSCTLPEAPATACYETATFNTTTCMWEVSGDQPEAPTTACYETATFNDDTCTWEVSGNQPEAPATACYETAAFNADPAVCAWEVSGDQPEAPSTACYETATFNADPAVCAWEVSGDQPEAPSTACYETATFNTETCMWDVSGEEPVVDDGCDVTTDSYDAETCEIINTPDCPEGTSYNSVDCSCDTDVVTGCTDPCATNYDPGANSDDGSCTLPEAPATACYETATFNTETCMWDVTGEEPVVDDGCDVTVDAYDAETCEVTNTPDCPEGTTYNAADCSCDEDVTPCEATAGTISADVSSVCVGDAIVNVTIDDAGSSESSLFVITDGDGTMILATQDVSNAELNLSGAPAGTCQIWLLNYDGEITLPASGMVADLEGCFALSNAIDILREDCVEKGSISSIVYNDSDRNGVQDAGEPGIEGVTVNLIDGDGNIVDSTTTDADGNYSFSEVEPGDYTVQVVYTGDLVNTGSGSYDVTVGSGEAVVAESDFGFAEEEDGFDCADLIVMVSGTCNDSDSQYQLTITIEGAFGDSYTVSSASDAAMNGSTVGGSFTTDFFDAGAAFDYMITSVNNPDCSVTVSASQFVCTVTAIELIDFDGRTVDTNNEIFWTTATETDNDYFTLQRSEDGINFEVVDLINGAGNSSTPTAYTFVDVDAPATSYYRLLATDFAGVTEIVSDVISLNRSNDVTVEVYPVPASDVLNIELGSISEDFTVVVIDITGKVVKSTDFDGNQNEINLDITDLSTGTYFLQVQQTNGEFITTKFIKE